MTPKTSAGKITMGSKSNQVDWVIMLYIAADGNLANFAVESLKQLLDSVGTTMGAYQDGLPSCNQKVVVAAQFAIDAPGGLQIPRYIFDQTSGEGIGNSLAGYLNAPSNMTEQEALSSFLQW